MVGVVLLIVVILGLIAMLLQRWWTSRISAWDTYLIKQGHHYSQPDNWLRWLPFKLVLAPKTLRFTAIFGDGTDKPAAEDDVNKLYGMTFGFDPEYRSIRVGWRANPKGQGYVELFAYWHENGKRGFKYLGKTLPYQEVHFSIWHDGKKSCWVSMRPAGQEEGQETTIEVLMSGLSRWVRFRLFPYFGGTVKAPCNVKIFIRNE